MLRPGLFVLYDFHPGKIALLPRHQRVLGVVHVVRVARPKRQLRDRVRHVELLERQQDDVQALERARRLEVAAGGDLARRRVRVDAATARVVPRGRHS